jgi:hypothetical protein
VQSKFDFLPRGGEQPFDKQFSGDFISANGNPLELGFTLPQQIVNSNCMLFDQSINLVFDNEIPAPEIIDNALDCPLDFFVGQVVIDFLGSERVSDLKSIHVEKPSQ